MTAIRVSTHREHIDGICGGPIRCLLCNVAGFQQDKEPEVTPFDTALAVFTVFAAVGLGAFFVAHLVRLVTR